jgi:hypothetical protein
LIEQLNAFEWVPHRYLHLGEVWSEWLYVASASEE